jgi:hypothetical protein
MTFLVYIICEVHTYLHIQLRKRHLKDTMIIILRIDGKGSSQFFG